MKKILLLTSIMFLELLSIAQENNASLVFIETNILIDKNSLHKRINYEIRINNRSGEKYCKIHIPYSKQEKIANVNAYIKDYGGRIVKRLNKSEVIEKSSISNYSFYEDNYIKEFTLKHNSYPYSIVCSYEVQETEFFYIEQWHPVLDVDIPTTSAILRVTVPLNYKINYKNQNVKSPAIDTIDNMVYYEWNTNYNSVFEPEVLCPPISEFIPLVRITPYEFIYDKPGTYKDWISYGDWEYQLLQGLDELPEDEKSRIQTLISGINNEEEKIKILYHYLQDNTRYISINIEKGGLKPYSASYVSQNKYGDCKALTNYFKSVLKFAGINSFYTNVNAGDPIKEIKRDFPSQQCNHVILYVPLKDKDIWLDCTSKGAFDYLGTFTQNRDVLIIDYNNSRFLRTPALCSSDVLNTRKIEIKYKQQEAVANFRNIYRGEMYEKIMGLDKNYNESDKSYIIREEITDEGFQLIDYKISPLNRDSARLNFAYNGTSKNIYKHYGNDILITNIAFPIPYFEKPDRRRLPVQIDFPIYMSDTLLFEIPPGYEVNSSNNEYSVSGKYGFYNLKWFENDKTAVVIKTIMIYPGLHPISEYEDFYTFYKNFMEIENKNLFSLKLTDKP